MNSLGIFSGIITSFLAIEQDESIAESVGINTARFKVISLCVGCFFAGIAGGIYAHFFLVLSPTSFTVIQSVDVLVYVIVGGARSFSGPIIGALILTLIPEVFRGLSEYQPFVFSGILFVIIFGLPTGLAGLPEKARSLFGKFRRRSIGAA